MPSDSRNAFVPVVSKSPPVAVFPVQLPLGSKLKASAPVTALSLLSVPFIEFCIAVFATQAVNWRPPRSKKFDLEAIRWEVADDLSSGNSLFLASKD